MLALAGAFAFVLSAMKLPSVTGSCSHPTGMGLGAVLFGPAVASVLATIVLIYQALLLAHGGITTLGANVFSMGIMGPFVAFFVYKTSIKAKLGSRISIFLAAAFGDLATYMVTSLQLALAFPSATGGIMGSFEAFAAIFAFTQIPLAIVEGIVTVIIFKYIIELRTDILIRLKVLKSVPTEGGNQ